MSRFVRQLNKLNERLFKIQTYANSPGNKDITDITVNIEILAEIWSDFRSAVPNLPDDQDCITLETQIEENYKTIRAILLKLQLKQSDINPKTEESNPIFKELVEQQRTFLEQCSLFADTGNRIENRTTADVKLPKLSLTVFDGTNYQNWPAYKDFFLSTIHKNPKLSKIQKYQYLIQSLKGKALELIDGLNLSTETYDEAWEKLNSRYNKPDKIAFSYIDSFINQPSTSRSSALEVRRIYESADEAIRGLRALGEQAETRDIWVIYLLLNKLDPESRLLWSREAAGSEMPTLKSFLEFLNNRAAELEGAQLPSKFYPKSNKVIQFHNSTLPQCIKCSQHHLLYRCPDFRQLTVLARSQFVNQNHLCHNCLNSGHLTNNCISKYVCRLCSMKHHTLLHNQRNNNFSNRKLAEADSYHILPEQHNVYYPPANKHELSPGPHYYPNSNSNILQSIYHKGNRQSPKIKR